ncbi:cytosolic endo-beta-N-acetylglucosaminidase-like isoform X2 [Clytia hemisphaerica]|uniref:cytosolic endo-beta-N-acetylglucosaminidase-like isoform X2 n=1 Tax=Clytia hemisphaerica TaxID=252671 RepID=UPI0034D7612E
METSNEPFTKPYKDHENFLKWESDYPTAKDVVEYDKSLWSRDENRPKTLLCHDMRGGYLQDRFDQGYPSTDCYSFYHWHLVDVFCYFSHHFVTIPPVQWINAAHKNGVKMIGTIITEWDEGRKNLQKVLKSKEAVEVFVKCLVGIATKMKFEGWLVNIECHVEDEEMDQLVYLVKHLTDEMHKSNNDAQVIWYDSVIKSGQLRWQNKLCADNRLFFDVCDGIFLNYNWSPIHLTESLAQAKQRKHDVYVGVDIFGRGCPGGGGWNTNKALKIIREHDLSAAIFAFGWVYEKLGESVYHINNEMFWELLSDDLYPHYINRLPMVTTFNRGYGHSLFKNGKKISNRPISNLSLTDMQPTFPTNRYQVISGCPIITELAYKTDDAYNGNGCLFFSGTFEDAEQTNDVMFRLFKTDLRLTKKEASQLTILLTYKNNSEYHAQPKLVLCRGDGDKMVLDSYDTISVQNRWQIQEHRHKLNQDIHIKEIQLHLQSTNNGRGRFQFLLGEFKPMETFPM